MILSIQSHVSYGYVGNRVATFILQRMGFDVVTINTVQFSNHTGYGAWKGDLMSIEHLKNVLEGLKNIGALAKCQALLSGYLGSPDTADVVIQAYHEIKNHCPELTYVCDPVMGDVGRGLFVAQTIPDKFKNDVIPHAFSITPNLFELEVLVGQKIENIASLKTAITSIPNPVVIVTSVVLPDLDPGQIHMVMKYKDAFLTVHAPHFHFDTPPNGSGDAVAALFLGHYLKTKDPEQALYKTNNAMHHLFKTTHKNMIQTGTRELALIQSQGLFE